MGAVAFSRLGARGRGQEWAERALAADPEDASVCYNVACLYALERRPERAIELLERALRAGFAHRDWIERDPDLASVREEPGYRELLRTH
jgi:non-specific serine/threonine protein kinase